MLLDAVGAIGLLVSVASVKTLFTKEIFDWCTTPIAYSLLSAFETAVLLLPFAITESRQRCLPQPGMMLRLALVCIAIAADFALSNEAIYRLPLALQQAIASTIPAATIVLETIVRWQCKGVLEYVAIAVLCLGAVLAHIGTGVTIGRSSNPEELQHSFYWGEVAMVTAVLSAAAKYVFAKSLLTAYREELGACLLLLWIEAFLCAFLLPWSLLTHQLQSMVTFGYGPWQWASLVGAGAMGGFRFFCELAVLRYWSATTLSAANLSAHSFIIVISIPLFGTPVTPFLIAGVLLTLGASAFYAYLLLVNKHEAAQSPRHPAKTLGLKTDGGGGEVVLM